MSKWHSGKRAQTKWYRALRFLPCYYCGREGGTVDHPQPLSKGGARGRTNCVPCCSWCNQKKGDKTEVEFREWLEENWKSFGFSA
jgi:5-methylcytosine-specific restriction endonuclease McrA